MSSLRPIAAAALLSVAPLSAALAGAWEVKPVVSAAARYNDNPALQAESFNPRSVYSTIANVVADISWLEPDATFTLSPQIKQTWYPDSDFRDLNSTDYFLRGSYNKSRPKWAWGISGRYDYQSVLSSEDLDPEDPGNDGGGGNFLRVDDERERYSVSPNLSWTPTRKDTFLFGLSASRTDYQLDFTNRADVDGLSGTFSYDRLITPRQSVGFIATAYKSESERRGGVLVCADGSLPILCPGVIIIDAFFTNDASGQSFSLSYAYSWSETLRIRLSYGSQETDVESGIEGDGNVFVNEDSFKSNQYNISFQGARERLDWDVTLSRSVQPASNGTPADKIQVATEMTYRFTEKLNGRLLAIGYDQESRSAFTQRENRFVRVDATLAYSFNRAWGVGLTYTFRNRDPQLISFEDLEDIDPDANENRKSNQVTLTTRYRF